MSTLEQLRDALVRDIDESLGLIRSVNLLAPLAGATVSLNASQLEKIIEWAFVNVYTDWENFIEDCFLAYMTGTQTSSGYSPTRYVSPVDEQHALKLILAGRDFFQWNRPKRVWEQAELCFVNGEPFKIVLESAAAELAELTIIRNEIVHRSNTSNEKFRTFVRNKLRTAPLNITPGQFLVTIKPRTLGTTFIAGYCRKLKVVAKGVAPD